MKRSIVLPLVFLVACATAPPIPENAHGLRVVADLATQQRIARADPSKELTDLASLGVATDLRYATPSNFMKKTLYPATASAWLRAPAARALADADRELRQRGLALKVYDAYRPYRVTVAMWEPIRNPDYVADPAKGSRHNRGAAVDVTIIDLATRTELAMPTAYDDFTERAAHAFEALPADASANRALLLDLMTRHGFDPLPSEWWHYDFRGWERFELMDVPLEDLASPTLSRRSPTHDLIRGRGTRGVLIETLLRAQRWCKDASRRRCGRGASVHPRLRLDRSSMDELIHASHHDARTPLFSSPAHKDHFKIGHAFPIRKNGSSPPL